MKFRWTRARAYSLVGLVALGGILPVAYSNEVNDLLGFPDAPTTGNDGLDSALAQARGLVDPVAEAYNQARPAEDEPQIPTTFFHDDLDGTSRVGGWGSYDNTSFGGAAANTWRKESLGPQDAGYRFWDPSTGWYPTSSAAGGLDAYLLTPRISLVGISLDLDDARTCGGAEECPSALERLLPHETDAAAIGHDQVDGAAPIPVSLQNASVRLVINTQYNLGMGDVADVLVFKDQAPTSAASLALGTSVAGAGLAGASAGNGFVEAAFALDRFAGHNVWVAFHVHVQPVNDPVAYFSSQFAFNQRFGWSIAAIDVTGPAYAHNVRVDELRPPATCTVDAGGVYSCEAPSGAGQDPLGIIVLNHGQFTEHVTPSLELRRTDTQASVGCSPSVPSIRMVPGGLVLVNFTCAQTLDEGVLYAATFGAAVQGSDPDLHPSDNTLRAEILGFRGTKVVWDALTIDPATSGENDPRDVRFVLENRGLGREPIETALSVRNGTGDLVTADPTTVSFIAGSEPVSSTFTLEAGAQRALSWRLALPKAGVYQIQVDVKVNGHLTGQARTTASTLLTQPLIYHESFDGGAGGWTVQRLRDAKPPNAVPNMDDQYVLEKPRHVSIPGKSAPTDYTTMLILYPDPKEIPNQPQFDGIEVRLLRYMDLKCSDFAATTFAAWTVMSVPQKYASECAGDQGHYRTTLELLVADGGTDLGLYKSTLAGLPADWPVLASPVGDTGPTLDPMLRITVPLSRVSQAKPSDSDPLNAVGFYSGQWIEETYRVTREEISPNLDSFPPNFRVVLGVPPQASCDLPSPPAAQVYMNNNCGVVRIARAAVLGTANGVRTPIVYFNGGVPGEYPEVGIVEDSTCPLPYGPGVDTGYEVFATTNELVPEKYSVDGCFPDERAHRVLIKDMVTPDIPANINTWHLADYPTMVGGEGVWTTSTSSMKYNPDGALELLVGPPIHIPDAAGDPTLQFQHKFTLQGLPFEADHGMLMVRMLDGERPTTPFMPVAVRLANNDEAWSSLFTPGSQQNIRLAQRYAYTDCEYYGSLHPNADGPCTAMGLLSRQMVTESVRLANIPILNYTRINDMLRGAMPPTSPDAAALERVDLRGKDVQFAFRFFSLEALLTDGQNGKAAAHANNLGGEGWYIGDVTIRPDSQAGHDIQVAGLQLTADYDWVEKSLGPGTKGSLNVTLFNKGLFEESKLKLSVQVQDISSKEISAFDIVDPPGFRIGPLQTADVEIAFTAPVAGSYRLLVKADLHGNLAAGIPLLDENPADNCASLNDAGIPFLGSCDFLTTPALNVVPRPALSVTLTVTPLAGRSDYPRQRDVVVANDGNIDIDDAELSLVADNVAKSGIEQTESWTITEPLEPGETASWTTLSLNRPADPLLELADSGQYLITAKLTAAGASAFDKVVLASFDNFYSDRFDPGTFDGSSFMTGTMVPDDAAWAIQHGVSYQGGQASWQFGDPVHARYPADSQAHLELPRLDLSTASKVRLSFAHKYDLEAGYDGGRLEASLDEGATWIPIDPIGGYPSSLLPPTAEEAALGANGRPGAFSGDSHGTNPPDGWTTSEFDLADIKELTTDVALTRLDQEAFILDRVNTALSRSVSYDTTWSLPGKACPINCWYRENLRAGNHVPPISGNSHYWWSGSSGPGVSGQTVMLPLDVDLTGLDDDSDQSLLHFWAWKDRSGTFAATAAPHSENTFLPVGVQLLQQRPDGWREHVIDLSAFNGHVVRVRFSFGEMADVSATDQGLILDDVALQVYDRGAGSPVLDPLRGKSFPPLSPAWGDMSGELGRAGSLVVAGDGDHQLVIRPTSLEFVYRDLDGNGSRSPGEPVYLQPPLQATVSPGAIRFSDSGGLPSGTRIQPDDPDRGQPVLKNIQASFRFRNDDGVTGWGPADAGYVILGPSTNVKAGDIRLTHNDAPGFRSISAADDDVGDPTMAMPSTFPLFSFLDSDGYQSYSAGDLVYLDLDNSTSATAADVRLVSGSRTERGTKVNSTMDPDHGIFRKVVPGTPTTPTTQFAQVGFRDLAPDGFGVDDPVYLARVAGIVSVGDLRMSKAGSSEAGTLVQPGDADVGAPLAPTPSPKYAYTQTLTPNVYGPKDTVYLTFGTGSPQVRVGDIRLNTYQQMAGMSRVRLGDPDVDLALPAQTLNQPLSGDYWVDFDRNGIPSAGDGWALVLNTFGTPQQAVRFTSSTARQILCGARFPCALDWRQTSEIKSVPSAWNLTKLQSNQGDLRKVWWFGNRPTIATDQYGTSTYPTNAAERLVTPQISLKSVGGSSASLKFWQHYDLHPHAARAVHVKKVDPALGADLPWETVYAAPPRTMRNTSAIAACAATNNWCPVEVDITKYIGQEIIVAFQINSTETNTVNIPGLGAHWAIDGVEINAESIIGQPIRLRFAAITDPSIAGEGWTIDNLQVVGLTYARNLAIVPDDPDDLSVREGGTLDLRGFVRNLGPRQESGIRLAVRADGIKEVGQAQPAPLESIQAILPNGQPADLPLVLPVGPAGIRNTQGEFVDRLPYHVRLKFPSGETDRDYRVVLYLIDEAGSQIPLADDNLGDHERQFNVHLETVASVSFTAPALDHPTTVSGQPVHVNLDVVNDGTANQFLTASLRVTNLETGQIHKSSPLITADLLLPGTSRTLDATWVASGQGFYRLEFIVDYLGAAGPKTDALRVGHVLVDRLPIYYTTNLESGLTDWNSLAAPAHAACSPSASSDGASQPWRAVDGLGYAGSTGFHVGVVLGEDGAAMLYKPRQDSILDGPVVDFTSLGDLATPSPLGLAYTLPESPFNPSVAFRYHALLGGNDGVIVSAKRSTDLVRLPLQNVAYPGQGPGSAGLILCNNPLGDKSLQPPNTVNVSPRGAITGLDEQWRSIDIPLGGQRVKTTAGNEPILGYPVQLSWRFGSDFSQATLGTGFTIDSVSVSSYRATILPAEEHLSLGSGADKTFHFLVSNTGAADDIYTVRLGALSQYPSFYTVSASPSELHLAAGKSAPVEVRIQVSDDPRLQPSVNDLIILEAVSKTDPVRGGVARLVVDRFSPTSLADLMLTLQPAGSSLDHVTEGDRVSLLATVRNIGNHASVATDLKVFACPATEAGLDVDLDNCQGTYGGTDLPLPIASVPVQALTTTGTASPLHPSFKTYTIRWNTLLGQIGDWHILGLVDPAPHFVQQPNVENDLAHLSVKVQPLAEPDLRAFGLKVLDEAGQEVHAATAGQALTIEGHFTNAGQANAENVVLSLSNQFSLRQDVVPSMPPGRTVDFMTTWVAEPGNFLVRLEAGTTTPELRQDNNLVTWPLVVRPGTVNASIDPPILHIPAGGGQSLRLHLHNGRDATLEAGIHVSLPEGLVVNGLPDTVSVPRGADEDLDFLVEVSPFESAPELRFVVELRDATTAAPVGTATATVFTAAQRFLRFTAQPLAMPPGAGVANVTVNNAGDAPEAVRLAVQAPVGWGVVTIPSTLVVPAQSTATIQVHVQTPDGERPGDYDIVLLTPDGRPATTMKALITQSPQWKTVVERVRMDPGALPEAWIRITNVGNAPGVPPTPTIEGADNASLSIEPPISTLASGAQEVYHVRVQARQDLVAGATLAVAGAPPVRLSSVVAESPRIEVSSWDVLPIQGVTAGEKVNIHVTLRNGGAQRADSVPVRLFVDGTLAAEKLVDLDAGGTKGVDLAWTSTRGQHVLAVTAGPPESAAARATALNVDQAASAPGAPIGVFVAALLAMLVLRRRKEATA